MRLATEPPKCLEPEVVVGSAQPERVESSSRPEEGESDGHPEGNCLKWRRSFFQSSALKLPPRSLVHFREQQRTLTIIHFHKQKNETHGIEPMIKGHSKGLRLQR